MEKKTVFQVTGNLTRIEVQKNYKKTIMKTIEKLYNYGTNYKIKRFVHYERIKIPDY